MISYFGASAYPTGVVGRTSGIISNTGWNNRVVVQSNTVNPGVSIQLNNKNYNSGSRTLTGSIVAIICKVPLGVVMLLAPPCPCTVIEETGTPITS